MLKDRASDRNDEVFVDLRAFVLPAIDYLMPGGLTPESPSLVPASSVSDNRFQGLRILMPGVRKVL
jgi:hypothetical protein